jgi:hypothetical protein
VDLGHFLQIKRADQLLLAIWRKQEGGSRLDSDISRAMVLDTGTQITTDYRYLMVILDSALKAAISDTSVTRKRF